MAFFLLILFFLLVIYAILIDYYRRAWNNMPVEDAPKHMPSAFISVIVAVRNEEKNIAALLSSLEQQLYPEHLYEVIVVDDRSTDNTWDELMKRAQDAHPPVCLRLQEKPGEAVVAYKKKAIETGIAAAKGQLIVTTDADCRFHSQWLVMLADHYERTGAKFIAAPVTMAGKGNLLNIFQSLDFLTLQGITGASVYKKFHTMCNGANLAYDKAAFAEVNGFAGIDNIPSGDDMLLMHKIFKNYPGKVHYLKNKMAIVVTEPAHSWKEFFHQRIRWASKASHYNDKRIFWVLLLVYLINAGLLVLGIASLWESTWLFFLVLLLIAKLLIEFPFVNAIAIFYDQQYLMKYFPFMQPLHILYIVVAGWLGKFGSYEWKGRKIKN